MKESQNREQDWKELAKGLKGEEARQDFSLDAKWAAFQKNLAATPGPLPLPMARPWARYFLPMAGMAAMVVAVFGSWIFLRPMAGVESTQIVINKNGELPLAELPDGRSLLFKNSVTFLHGPKTWMKISSGTEARLLADAPEGSIWFLEAGRISVSNDNPAVKARFLAGDIEIQEVGTIYEMERVGETLKVIVQEGNVSISNLRDQSHRSLGKNMTWEGDIRKRLNPVSESGLEKKADPSPHLAIKLTENSDASAEDKSRMICLRGKSLELWGKSPVSLIAKKEYDFGDRSAFLALEKKMAALLTVSGKVFLFDDNLGLIREQSVGPVAAGNLMFRPQGLFLLNAQGEIFQLDLSGKVLMRKKILRSSLWEGVVSGNFWVLPDVEARLVVWEFSTLAVLSEKELSAPVLAPLQLEEGVQSGDLGSVVVSLPSGMKKISLQELLNP